MNGGGIVLYLPDEIEYATIPGYYEDEHTGLILPDDDRFVSTKPLAEQLPKQYHGTSISMFSGCGGFDIGTTMAGFETRVFIEMEPNAVSTLKHNAEAMGWGHAAILDCPIETLTVEQVLFAARLDRGECDLLTGGFPCQPFSKAGKQKGTTDHRGHLFYECSRMIDGIQPRTFILENVKGILSSSGGADIRIICREFDSLGYSFAVCMLNAANYGVPQNRERVFFVGVRPDQGVTGEDVARTIIDGATHFDPENGRPSFQPLYRWDGSDLVQINEKAKGQHKRMPSAPRRRGHYI